MQDNNKEDIFEHRQKIIQKYKKSLLFSSLGIQKEEENNKDEKINNKKQKNPQTWLELSQAAGDISPPAIRGDSFNNDILDFALWKCAKHISRETNIPTKTIIPLLINKSKEIYCGSNALPIIRFLKTANSTLMLECPNCQTENEDDWEFCIHCELENPYKS